MSVGYFIHCLSLLHIKTITLMFICFHNLTCLSEDDMIYHTPNSIGYGDSIISLPSHDLFALFTLQTQFNT